jgi:hypothetical protein
MTAAMLTRKVTMYGAPCVLACDGRCDKAWGINRRPKRQLSADVDDYVFLGDAELGTVGERTTWEGGEGRPSNLALRPEDSARMNKWCARECKRCTVVGPSDPIRLRDLRSPLPNIPRTKKQGRRMKPPAGFTKAELVGCVERELRLRERAYPGWIARGRMTETKATAEIAAMRAVLAVVVEALEAATPTQADLFGGKSWK